MSILDINNIVEDRTVEIKQWLKTNCSFTGIEFNIHNNIVDVNSKKYHISMYIHFHIQDEYFPTDIFKFGKCEIESDSNSFRFGKPIINIALGNCPNLKSLSGLPNNIKTLNIYDCPKLETLGDMSININDIILHDHQFEYRQELLNSIQQYENHKLLIL